MSGLSLKLVGVASLFAALAYPQPVINPAGTVNGADYSRALAPGAIAVVYGSQLASGFFPAPAMPLPTSLGGTSVQVSDGVRTVLAPLYYVMPGQVAFQLPYDMGPNVTVRVVTPAGTSNPDTLTLVGRAPRLFSVDQSGKGRAVALHADWEWVSRQKPMKPGEWISLYANSMGAVTPPIAAGVGAGDGKHPANPLNVIPVPTTVLIDNKPAQVGYAGLVPYISGVYQINVFTPYYDVLGDLEVRVVVEGASSQADMTLPAEPNGFYWVLGAGKFPNGQTRTAVPGPGSAIAFMHMDRELWGDDGYGRWTLNSHLGPEFRATSGLALTLRLGGVIVYDNNGIEDGTHGGYYDNSAGTVPDAQKPGLYEWYSMSGHLRAIFAGYFRLTQATTFDEIIGYFDGNGNPELRFDPANVYNRFRMNIWSNGPGGTPAVNSFTGDVFSSDSVPGTFELSRTNVDRVFRDGARDRIWRVVYRLSRPFTLPAGEYWFSHDVATPDSGLPARVLELSGLRERAANLGRLIRPIPDALVMVVR